MKRIPYKPITYQQKKIQTAKVKLLYNKMRAKKRWKTQKKTFSPYPYIMTVSYYKTNVFFTVADIEGHTKTWTSSGRSGFKNKDKTTYMAVVRTMGLFLKKVWGVGIRHMILKFRNLYERQARFAVRFTLLKFRHRYLFKYLGFIFQNQMAFNGCRKKKRRRI